MHADATACAGVSRCCHQGRRTWHHDNDPGSRERDGPEPNGLVVRVDIEAFTNRGWAGMQVRGKPAIETGPPLLEREASLALLTEYAAQASGGEGRLVLLSGEAGVGKSALVERLCRDLPDARWSWSMCDGLFTPRPLGPLFDLADQLGGELLERVPGRGRPGGTVPHAAAAAQRAGDAGRGGRRGHPLGRRGHPRPAPLPGPSATRRRGAAHRHLPGRRPGRR